MSLAEVPHTQSTAPVFEYQCLFTSDLRRKQKRWQDGQLKFHTFNNRVMVYDDRSNFVGDTHWRQDELNEGEELELERRGILVQVGECTGQKNQDVSELVDKPRKEKEDRAAARAAATPAREHGPISGSEFLQPRPLNQMLTPSGHYGRAVISNVSPFEEKHRLNKPTKENERPAKRHKTEETLSKNGYAQNLMGASLNLSSSRPPSTATIQYENLKLKTVPARKPKATIDLTNDSDSDRGTSHNFSKDNEHRERPVASVQRRNRSSNVAKNGYVRNLAGAALSLSRPTELPLTVGNKFTNIGDSPVPMEVDEEHSSMRDEVSPMPESPTIIPRKVGSSKAKKLISSPDVESRSLQAIFESSSSPPPAISTESFKSAVAVTSRNTFHLPHEKFREAQPRNRRTTSPESKSSSPQHEHSLQPSVKRLSSNDAVALNASVSEQGSVKATSSLRIKSRAPRKMMMLMDRPTTHKTRVVSVGRSISMPKSNPRPAPSEVVLSQATLQLDAFRQEQEGRLQMHLESYRSKVNDDDLIGSPPDSGIDHQTLDLLLSRKPKQREDTKPSVAKASHDLSLGTVGNDLIFDRSINSSIPSPQVVVKNVSLSPLEMVPSKPLDHVSNSPKNEFDRLGILTTKSLLQETGTGKLLQKDKNLHSNSNHIENERSINKGSILSTSQHHTPDPVESSLKENLPSSSRIAAQEFAATTQYSLSNPQNITDHKIPPVSSEQDVSVSGQYLQNTSSPRLDNDASRSTGSQVNSVEFGNRAQALKKGVGPNSYEQMHKLQEETPIIHQNVAHDGQQIQSSHNELPNRRPLPGHTTSVVQTTKEPLERESDLETRIFRPRKENARSNSSQKETPISTAIAPIAQDSTIKPSPKPSLVDLNMPQVLNPVPSNNDELQERQSIQSVLLSSTNIIPQTMERPMLQPALAPPRPRVVNPATRGKSLQAIAANTVDALAPAFNTVMPPPAPRSLIRVNKSNPRVEIAAGCATTSIVSVGEDPMSGPWSRESFDLFGAWKPPARHIGTKLTT